MILVTISRGETKYRRYDGRVRTHEVEFEQPLDAFWLNVLRVRPGELAPISSLRGKYVQRRSHIPTPPIVTLELA